MVASTSVPAESSGVTPTYSAKRMASAQRGWRPSSTWSGLLVYHRLVLFRAFFRSMRGTPVGVKNELQPVPPGIDGMRRLGLAIIKQAMRDVVPHILSEMVAEQSLDFVGNIFPRRKRLLVEGPSAYLVRSRFLYRLHLHWWSSLRAVSGGHAPCSRSVEPVDSERCQIHGHIRRTMLFQTGLPVVAVQSGTGGRVRRNPLFRRCALR